MHEDTSAVYEIQPRDAESSSFPWWVVAFLIVGVTAVGLFGNKILESREPVVVPAVVEDVVPCDHRTPEIKGNVTTFHYNGPGYMHRKDGRQASHCRPCDKAKSSAEKFVCEGDA